MTKTTRVITIILITASSNLFGQSVDSLIQTGTENCYDNPDSAITLFNRALEIDPDNKNAIVAKMNCFLLSAKTESALEYANELVLSDTTNADFYFIRGTVKNTISFTDSSCLEDYRKAIQIDPNYFDALFNIAAYYFNLSALLTDKLNAEQANTDQLLKQKEEYLSKALAYMERASRLQPNMLEIQQHLLSIYSELNMEDKKEIIEAKIKENSR